MVYKPKCQFSMWTFHCSQKCPFVCPNTSGAPHTSSSNQSSTVVRNSPSTWLFCISTGSTQVVICPTIVTCFTHPPITEQPPTQSHWIKGVQPYPGCIRGSNCAMLLGPQHTPHYSTAVYTLHAWLERYYKYLYKPNSSSCILVDYCSKSEWKFGKEYYWRNNTNPTIKYNTMFCSSFCVFVVVNSFCLLSICKLYVIHIVHVTVLTS